GTRIGRSVRLMTLVSLVTSIAGIPVVIARVVIAVVVAAVVVILTVTPGTTLLRGLLVSITAPLPGMIFVT
nr:hypothetical protein [Tanacetum cinerariifolium]